MTATLPFGVGLPQGLADNFARHGDAVAVIGAHGSLTYRELEERVAAAASALGSTRRLQLLPADNTIETIVSYLAALRARCPVIVCSAGDLQARDAIAKAYDINGAAHDLHPDLAVLLSTSGSTGTPKLVRLSHDNLVSNAASIIEALGIGPDDRAITTLPLHYCYGLSVLNSYLLAGASVVLSDLSVVDACFWNLARAQCVTSLAGVPHTFELLERIGFTGAELPSLRYITQAGGRMSPERITRFAALGATNGFDLVVMYGQTEATARMAYLPPRLASSRPSSIGVAVPGGELRIDAPDVDGTGELVYRGDNVMLGYATNPRDLALGRVSDELHTGDLARRTDDGLFEIVGRSSRFIKPFGVRVDLDHLEQLLVDGGVTALCTGDDERLVVGVVGGGANSAAATVAERLHLPRSYVTVIELDELPRLANSKPDYAALRVAAMSPTPVGGTSLREAFVAILGVDPGDTDTFVSLGGDSLSYVEMSINLEEQIGALPRDWHVMPFAALDALAVPHDRTSRTRVDTALAIRAIAIVLIVGSHTDLWHIQGGAHALIAVAGFNFARFQLTGRAIFRSTLRVIVPSVLWVGAVALFSEKFGLTHALLVNDFFGKRDSLWSFWFIEAIVQISLALAVVFAIPAVSRFERSRPLATAYLALVAGLAVRFDVIDLTTAHRSVWPHEVFFVFALGWVAARAPSNAHRVAATAVAMLCVPGYFTNGVREFVVIAAIAAIAWLPTLRVPRSVVRVLTPLAGASLYIYLTHLSLHDLLARNFGSVVATTGSLVAGVATWRIAQRVEAWLSMRQWRFGRVDRTKKATGTMLTSSSTNAGSAAIS